MNLPANMDPSVAGLLQDLPESSPVSQIRTRLALLRLEQARVRGNSDFAAKVMDYAIEAGSRDREAYQLMQNRMRKLERDIESNEEEQDELPSVAETSESSQEQSADTTASQNDDDAGPVDQAAVDRLSKEVADAKESAEAMEKLLVVSIKNEIESVQNEQKSLSDRQSHLRSRVQALETTLQGIKGCSEYKELEQLMSEVQEDQSTLLHTDCAVCHETKATRAVIPCGHLCLCNTCNNAILKTDQKLCPLCRGHMLSTLNIYTSK